MRVFAAISVCLRVCACRHACVLVCMRVLRACLHVLAAMHACSHVCLSVYVYLEPHRALVCVCSHTCLHLCVYTPPFACLCVHTCVSVCSCTFACLQMAPPVPQKFGLSHRTSPACEGEQRGAGGWGRSVVACCWSPCWKPLRWAAEVLCLVQDAVVQRETLPGTELSAGSRMRARSSSQIISR